MKKLSISVLALVCIFAYTVTVQAQDNSSIKFQPEKLTLNVGQTLTISAKVYDSNGKELKDRSIRFFSRARRSLSIDSLGNVTAHQPGDFSVIAISPDPEGNRVRADLPVSVNYPDLAKIEIRDVPSKIYEGTTIRLETRVFDELDFERDNVVVKYSTANQSVATIDAFGNLRAVKPGKTKVIASVDDIQSEQSITISSNPVTEVTMTVNAEEARTGDVFKFRAKAVDKSGKEITDIPILFTYKGEAYDVSSTAAGLINEMGDFVADEAGLYTITASSGPFSTQKTINVVDRGIERKVEFVGKGTVNDKHTSDFWVWEGVDGKDYAVTGTWGADGTAYFWDVTNPANMVKIDSVQVDARTVNDVKISEDGKTCIISREGASNRKNGIVIIDVTNPRDANVIATFTENLTGGVHNLFIYQNHVYALSAGRKYYVINIDDRTKPKIVGEFELETRGHAIHDVWVEDGIAYSSNWSDGVQLVDVGNGIAGGSPENPKQFASYTYPSGANHAAFPFRSKSTGKFYMLLGDEIFPYGLNMQSTNIAGGFIHVVDFTDVDNPKEVARFEVPGAGSHNFWVEDDILYVAFYNGGVRVVDLSGELMGDLYNQGREIGWIIPSDPDGYVPNAPFTWGAQPYKGHIFYSDWNSGLWAAKLEPEKPKDTKVETK